MDTQAVLRRLKSRLPLLALTVVIVAGFALGRACL